MQLERLRHQRIQILLVTNTENTAVDVTVTGGTQLQRAVHGERQVAATGIVRSKRLVVKRRQLTLLRHFDQPSTCLSVVRRQRQQFGEALLRRIVIAGGQRNLRLVEQLRLLTLHLGVGQHWQQLGADHPKSEDEQRQCHNNDDAAA